MKVREFRKRVRVSKAAKNKQKLGKRTGREPEISGIEFY